MEKMKKSKKEKKRKKKKRKMKHMKKKKKTTKHFFKNEKMENMKKSETRWTHDTPVARRPADAAAGDVPTVTRHAVEQREVIVVPASSGAPRQACSGEGVSAPPNPVPNLPKPTVARAQPSSAAVESSHHPSGERVDSSGPGGDVPMEVAQAVEPTTKSHAPVEEHDESLVPKRQRG